MKVQRLTPGTSAKKNIMETRESHTQWSEDIVRYSLEMRRVQNKESVCNEMQDKEGNESFKLGRIKPSSDGLADCKVTSRDKISISSVDLHISNIYRQRSIILGSLLGDASLFNDMLVAKFGIVFNITKNGTLYLPTKQYPAFEELVLPYMHNTMMYKLIVS